MGQIVGQTLYFNCRTKSGTLMIEIVLIKEILMFLRIFYHYVIPSSSVVVPLYIFLTRRRLTDQTAGAQQRFYDEEAAKENGDDKAYTK